MKNRSWGILAGLALLGLFWFMLDPRLFLGPRVSHSFPDETSAAAESAKQARREGASPADGQKPDIPVEVLLETGSGKELPGEKLVRVNSAEGYRKFLAMAPPGAVLGQIDSLKSVRVKTGSWLGNALAQTGGTASANFYVRVPEVPLEVRERGDMWYQAVGKKAMDLIGAEGVTDIWGRGVKVALMDTPVEGMDQVEGETAGHGTAMRSLIQGQSGAARGAAPGAEMLAFPVLDQDGKGSSFRLAEAIVKAADQGARVINMSLGSEGDSPVVRDAVAYALSRNVVLVAAAGNEAVNRVSYPAAYEGVIAVASVDAGGNHLYFSNRGKAVDVAAPGFAVVAAWPGGKNVEVTGTSASTALVSGTVAALLSREPGLSASQAAELVVKYADATGLPGSAEEMGGGVVNLQRILSRNQRGVVDMAVGGVTLKEEGSQGRILVGIQNRGTETLNSPSLEISAGEERRKFYFGSLAPGGTAMESMSFDLARARQEGGIGAGAAVSVRGDQQGSNDLWSGYFRISKEK
jgi:subtilisin family serine protease